MTRVPSTQRNANIRRTRDAQAFHKLLLLLCCGLVLTGGFVFAAQQYFTAIQYGYKSQALRRERDKLLAEKQQLLLKKEQSFAPARLENEARELGLKPLLASQVGTQKSGKSSQLPIAAGLINPSASFQR